jgi:hypothetical protein
MPTARKLIAGLALALTAVSCSDKSPTDVTTPDQQAPTAPAVAGRADLLRNLPVTGVSGPIGTPATTALTAPFSGTLTITRFDYIGGQLVASGTVTANGVTDDFVNAPATLVRGGAPTAPICDILILDIGRIELDLLGLIVDIAPISIDVQGETGPGNLLGNLLCALVGILDGPQLGGFLNAITNLLNQINAILGAV